MKKRVLFAMVLLGAAFGLKAQDCNALCLPFFGYDEARMASYPTDKLMYRCCYARAAFYESDVIPAGAEVFNIQDVEKKSDGSHIASDYVVDLNTLSYYAYNFDVMQRNYPDCDKVLCFRTPNSIHPFLVLRSICEMNVLSEQLFEEYRNQQH